MARIAVAIPTYRRPEGLRRLLRSLEAQVLEAEVVVVVADNGTNGREGLGVVEALLAQGYRFPVTKIGVAETGVAHVRNALFATVLKDREVDAVAMIDDDEWASPQWLAELLRIRAWHNADVVGGPVQPVFDSAPPAWASNCRYFYSEVHPDGPVEMVWGACNALMSRRALVALAPRWFDPDFGRSGGEDVEMFTRLKVGRYRFAWAAQAQVWEQVPQRRMRRDWVLRRAFRIGNSDMFVRLRWYYQGNGRLWAALHTAAHAGSSVASLPFLLWTPAARMRVLCDMSRVAGKVVALGGIRYHEYN